MATLKDVVDRIKAEGQLIRNTGTNSLKTTKEQLKEISTNISAQNIILSDTLTLLTNWNEDEQIRASLNSVSSNPSTSPQAMNRTAAAGFGSIISNTGSLISGVGKGVGFAGAGIGAALIGLSSIIDKIPDANSIKKSVETLLSIGDNYESRLDFFADGGTLSLMLTGLGVGLTAFAIGSGANVGVQEAIKKFEAQNWAEVVKNNVLTLLSIPDSLTAGSIGMLFEGGMIATALGGLGVGLASFGIGGAATAAIDGFSKDSDWANNIKSNVNTLLSIGEDRDYGALEVLGESGGVSLALAGLGAGLVAFGSGQGVLAAVGKFSESDWAQNVKNNVETLLSISSMQGLGFDTAKFIGVMGGLSLGLAAFALGKGTDTAVQGIDEALAYFTNQPDFAQRIYNQVETLLKIPNLDGIGGDVTGFIATMGGIVGGLTLFALGKGASMAVDGADKAISYFTNQPDFAQRIYDQVKVLTSITGLTEGKKATEFAKSLGVISAGLFAFTTAEFVGALASVGETIMGFFGSKSPFDKLMDISDNADKLERGASALEKIAVALNKFGAVEISNMGIDFAQLAEDLGKAIPLLKGLAEGGIVGGGWLSSGIDFGNGILDPALRLDEIASKIQMVRTALGVSNMQIPSDSPPSSNPDIGGQYRTGTDGFQNFGEGTIATLHGMEAVVPLNTPAGQFLNSNFDNNWQPIVSKIQAVQTAAMQASSAPAYVINAPTVAPITTSVRGGTTNNNTRATIMGENNSGSGLGRFAN